MTTAPQTFDDTHLDIDIECPDGVDEITLPELYIGLELDVLAPDNKAVTGRHHTGADSIDQISGQIPSATLSRWLRYGCEQVLQLAGATACHPTVRTADDNQADVFERDLKTGYHEYGSCTDEHDAGCLVYELFGKGGDQQGTLSGRPVTVSPSRQQVDVLDGTAHYCQSHTQARPRGEKNGQLPRQADRDVLGTIRGTWRLTLNGMKPDVIGIVAEAMSFLNSHSDAIAIPVDGAQTVDAEIADIWLINPLYSTTEVRRVFDPDTPPTAAMDTKDKRWRQDCRDAVTRAVQARTAARDGDLGVPTAGDGV